MPDFFLLLASVDLLGGTVHWSCTRCPLPPDSHQGFAIQEQGLRISAVFRLNLLFCFDHV